MATVYATVNGTVRSATEKAVQSNPSGGSPGKIIAEYEASSLATAQTINFCTVPAGCYYRARQLNHDAQGSGTSIKVGISGALEQQIVDTATTAAGVIPANAGGWKYAAADTDILGTNTGTCTGTYQLEVEFLRAGRALTL